ncbi:hypothetical protein JAAARDRAFT_191850 [Jaapia argillacea MUCL 33604]|uniref:BTB domain-containing protein n=1 Tax=Jaapia argillacea MUCL 33604 TaxID=933084 RepID=A0A067Q092_9AGAM|nr:hypothetical protein JAAARDRAFT_191850 [Jaapia argillacea MUCL 33604]
MTDSPTTTTPTPAKSPFNDPRADIILRSSDKIDFATFKTILSLSSPIFDDMFRLPQPSSDSGSQAEKDGVAVVEMTENGKELEMLLRFCHPGERPPPESIEDATLAMAVAMKYQVDFMAAASKKRLLELAVDEPARVFSIACLYKAKDLAIDSAKLALNKSEATLFPNHPNSIPSEFSLITARYIIHLLTYHRQCAAKMGSLTEAVINGIGQDWKPSCGHCGSRGVANPTFSLQHWPDFRANIRSTLNLRPSSEALKELARTGGYSGSLLCGYCSIRRMDPTAVELPRYCTQLSAHVDRLIAEVCHQLFLGGKVTYSGGQVPLELDF